MKHPKENNKDLRGKEDQDISVLFNRKRKMADDEGGIKKKQSIDQNHNNAQELSDEAALTPLPIDDLLDFSELNETKNESNLNEKSEENNNLTEFNNLLSKLSPLAKVDDSTISKLVENLEALSKLDLNKRDNTTDTKVSSAEVHDSGKDKSSDLSGLLFSCKSVQDVTSKFQEFEYSEEKGGVVCCVREPNTNNFCSAGFLNTKVVGMII